MDVRWWHALHPMLQHRAHALPALTQRVLHVLSQSVVYCLQLQARQQLDDAALQELELMLEEAAVMGLGPGVDPGEPRINYDLFTQVGGRADAAGKPEDITGEAGMQ